jgi:hypothetical protein
LSKRKRNIRKKPRHSLISKEEPRGLIKKAELEEEDKKISFSFSHLDTSQCPSLDLWEKEGLLCRVVDKMQHFSDKKISEATREGLKIYGTISTRTGFPDDSKLRRNRFIQNKVPIDAVWCKFEVGGLPRVIGHILRDVIYVVFFDKEHQFWPSKKYN